jgi:hypothetical protein
MKTMNEHVLQKKKKKLNISDIKKAYFSDFGRVAAFAAARRLLIVIVTSHFCIFFFFLISNI